MFRCHGRADEGSRRLAWIVANKLIVILVILVILLDGVVLNVPGARRKHGGGRDGGADLADFRAMLRRGEPAGLLAIGLTVLAVASGLLLGASLLLT